MGEEDANYEEEAYCIKVRLTYSPNTPRIGDCVFRHSYFAFLQTSICSA